MGQALLDPGEFGVVAEVATEVVADQHPRKSSRIPNPLIEAFVRFPAAPYQTKSAPPRV
jgi:hypothetical protein